jgi:hypothetical protein
MYVTFMMNYFIVLGDGMFPQEGRRSQENLLDNNLLYYVLVHGPSSKRILIF